MLVILWSIAPLSARAASTCAASAEVAARNLIGTPAASEGVALLHGFRAHDLLIDPVLKRVWVRVSDCAGGDRPLLLVSLGSGTLQDISFETGAEAPQQTITMPRKLAVIRSGDTVQISMQTSSLRMNLQGTAESSAAVGETLTVTLSPAKDSGEQPHHLRAMAKAAGQVELVP